MIESVSDEGQHRLGNGTISMQHPFFLLHTCHTTCYQQSYTGNAENLRRLAQVLYVCN